MKNEEAIETLTTMYPKKCKMIDGRFIGGYDDYESEKGQAVTLAISALEKQIPKKPKLEDCFTCPSCEYGIVYGDKHCLECGQLIDWDLEGEDDDDT